ncbi:flagellar filament capping protein FliD [Desulfosoma caldarium]|uniref:Flagellar hook-associated protein 2 n=1 Tax=Desulfosoma caldarium TaxID=610254 RepID=A0A3N1UHM6_9BACT|nr:flagellar filament capping protein FliD [Desulfosoma caldarium]ROQ90762.1 flagellar hook-associated protein 2 [Desulfosoma caldarium]
MGFSLSGVGSGFDWQSMLEQLRKVEQNQFINPLEQQKKKQEEILSAWNTVSQKLSDLLSAVQGIKSSGDFDVFTSSLTSSSTVDPESLLSVTVGSGAPKSRFDIQVTNLAKAEKLQSISVASAADPAGWTGTITIEGREVTLDGKSLNELRDEINALNTGSDATGVMAGVLKVADGDYRLILTSEEEGAAGFQFTDAAGDYFSTLQAGEDASFSIDGISMTRSSNTITDAIAGVTLRLRGEDASTTVTLNIDRDNEAVADKIQSLVDAYNGLAKYINSQFSYDAVSKKANGMLSGDAALRSIKNRLQTSLMDQGLFSVGITFSRDGTLELDTDKLQEALSQDFSGTVSQFNDMAQSLQSVLETLTDSVEGTVTTQKRSVQEKIEKLGNRMETLDERIDARMERLKAQFIAMENAMNTMNNQMSGLSQLFSNLFTSTS